MKTKISDSYARLGQVLLLMFFIPFVVILWMVVINSNFKLQTLLFAGITTLVSVAVIRFGFKFADVSMENGLLVMNRLFGRTIKDSKECITVRNFSILAYCLEFTDETKVYVPYGPTEIVDQVFRKKSITLIEKIKGQIRL